MIYSAVYVSIIEDCHSIQGSKSIVYMLFQYIKLHLQACLYYDFPPYYAHISYVEGNGFGGIIVQNSQIGDHFVWVNWRGWLTSHHGRYFWIFLAKGKHILHQQCGSVIVNYICYNILSELLECFACLSWYLPMLFWSCHQHIYKDLQA